MPVQSPRSIELLAPARDIEVARRAIDCGADAIYIGPASHGARVAAANSIDDIARLVEYAHRFRVKIYSTVNTIVYDREIKQVESLIRDLYQAGCDALIVQDMGILRMDIPPIDLHASTQCDIRSVEKARFLAAAGFSRLVLARELSLAEIARIHEEVEVELETFIHGALCVSYSGDCRASFAATGRSANRGECAQICRLKFDLTDGAGTPLTPARHYLSLRDLNRLADLKPLLEAGASSLKIEGRLKDVSYVMNTVAAYRKRLDEIIAESDGRYVRSSCGASSPGFLPDVDKSFNRGFTSYFFTSPSRNARMASVDTPKMTGRPVGKVVRSDKNYIVVKADSNLANGDGLGYFTPEGIFTGFRVNRVENDRIFPATKVHPMPGTILYRNRDKVFDDSLERAEPSRKIKVDLQLSTFPSGLTLTAKDERGNCITSVLNVNLEPAKSAQDEARRRVLTKTGDTIYDVVSVEDTVGNLFIPASLLTSLRREAINALDTAARATYRFRYRQPERYDVALPSAEITVHDNVANHLARSFYESHGAAKIVPAMEISTVDKNDETLVMTTKYCIRRELGACLLGDTPGRLPRDLYLESPGMKLHLCPDCKRCVMNIYYRAR